MTKFLVKLSISLSILLLLIFATDIEEISDSLYSIDTEYIVYALSLIVVTRFIMALRWKLLLSIYHIRASVIKLLEILFVSNAVGHVLPSGIGSDIIRVYELSRTKGCSEKILASVFLDRVFGLLSMITVALLAAWYAYHRGLAGLEVPLLISSAALMIPVAFIAIKYVLSKDAGFGSDSDLLARASGFYNRFIVAVQQTDIPAYGYVVLISLSVLVQLIRCIIFMCIFIGLGSDVLAINYFVFIPLVFILMLVPISVGGLGVRESALYAFFGPLGLTVATCTVAGLIFHALQLVMLVPGLIIFSLRR